ncbi:MAG: hypothetical protein ACREP4_13315 [Stenotrophomonas sp.]|uniref:hypothetical protein n=1 Tax=Stenotrophomonas sp. TaxID=69392 RepID=UPI003D6CD8AF
MIMENENLDESEQELSAMLNRLINKPLQDHVDAKVKDCASNIKNEILDVSQEIRKKVEQNAKTFRDWVCDPDNRDSKENFHDWVNFTRQRADEATRNHDELTKLIISSFQQFENFHRDSLNSLANETRQRADETKRDHDNLTRFITSSFKQTENLQNGIFIQTQSILNAHQVAMRWQARILSFLLALTVLNIIGVAIFLYSINLHLGG